MNSLLIVDHHARVGAYGAHGGVEDFSFFSHCDVDLFLVANVKELLCHFSSVFQIESFHMSLYI